MSVHSDNYTCCVSLRKAKKEESLLTSFFFSFFSGRTSIRFAALFLAFFFCPFAGNAPCTTTVWPLSGKGSRLFRSRIHASRASTSLGPKIIGLTRDASSSRRGSLACAFEDHSLGSLVVGEQDTICSMEPQSPGIRMATVISFTRLRSKRSKVHENVAAIVYSRLGTPRNLI